MKTLIAICTVSLLILLMGLLTGIKPVAERIYYGPDRSDCIRIEGCQDGDLVSWTHSNITTIFSCENRKWIIYDNVNRRNKNNSFKLEECPNGDCPTNGGSYDF